MTAPLPLPDDPPLLAPELRQMAEMVVHLARQLADSADESEEWQARAAKAHRVFADAIDAALAARGLS